MDSVTLNIFLYPESSFENELISLSQKINESYNLTYYVDGIRFFPHLSLLGLYIPDYNLKKVKIIAENLFLETSKVKVETLDLFCSDSGIVMLRTKKTSELIDLHNKVLKMLDKLRDGLIKQKYQDESYVKTLSKKDSDLISRYGSKWVLDNYDPHITFARLVNINDFRDISNKYKNTMINRSIVCDSVKITREHFGDDNRSEIIFEKNLQ